MKTSTLGASAGIGYLAPLSEPAGTDISAMLRMTASTGLPPVAGTDGETAKEAVAALADQVRRLVRLRLCRRGPDRRGSP